MAGRKAEIQCPHCGSKIVVRDAAHSRINWNAVNEMFSAMDKAFAKIWK